MECSVHGGSKTHGSNNFSKSTVCKALRLAARLCGRPKKFCS
jgi:hypothetical protein